MFSTKGISSLFVRLFRMVGAKQYANDVTEKSVHTAAIPSQIEPKEIHRGKRRLKEQYTSHWDLDYLPAQEVEKVYAKERDQKET